MELRSRVILNATNGRKIVEIPTIYRDDFDKGEIIIIKKLETKEKK